MTERSEAVKVRARVTGHVDPSTLPKPLVVRHEHLRGARFQDAGTPWFGAEGSTFDGCDFSGTRWEAFSAGSHGEQSVFRDCVFDNAVLMMGPGGYARFERCSFRGARIRDWWAFCVELVDCTFTGSIRKSWFNGTVPEENRKVAGRERNEFRGNDFSGAKLIDVDFRTGIDLSLQKLPEGPDFVYIADAAAALRRAHARVDEIASPADREVASRFLRLFDEAHQEGQQQFWFPREESLAAWDPALVEPILDALAQV